jgi:pantoate--beta-alanine ligase
MKSSPTEAPPGLHVPARSGAASTPRIVGDGTELRKLVTSARAVGKSVGLVPTMGALHEGHLSLVDLSRAECDLTMVTIFVNPTQFGPNEDLKRYPRNLDRDVAMLGTRGCDIVFAPTESEMYPLGSSTFVDVGPLGAMLEGEIRPTHFRGVATVCLKLFQLAPANRAYFGRKDYQQTLVVRQMVRDLNVPIDIRVCPIVREPDGLAMSSRNAYLSASERTTALALSRSLKRAEDLVRGGERDVTKIRSAIESEIESASGIELQYVAFVADGTLDPVTIISGPTTIALAAVVGKTRLIDNTLVAQP